MTVPLTTILIDSNTIFREGLTAILSETRFQPLARLSDPDELRGLQIPPSISLLFLVDFGSDPETAAASVALLKAERPDARVVVLADLYTARHVAAVVRAGADGYLLKNIAGETLIASLDLVMLGEPVFPAAILSEVGSLENGPEAGERDPGPVSRALSERELAILRRLVHGDPNKVIARKFEITEATVKVHIKAILRKIRVRNRTQAAIWAVDHGLATMDEASLSRQTEPSSAPPAM